MAGRLVPFAGFSHTISCVGLGSSKLVPKRARPTPDKDGKIVAQPVGFLGYVAAVHNFNLSFGSLIMLLGCASEVIRRGTTESSFEFVLCENPATSATGPLFFWSYVYYLSKYYELLDTVLTLMRGSTLPHPFLHIFHHVMVVFMSYLWLSERQSTPWQCAGVLASKGCPFPIP